jgi:hypothetical protein
LPRASNARQPTGSRPGNKGGFLLLDHRSAPFGSAWFGTHIPCRLTITDETNTKVERADYRKAAFELLAGIIGNLHPHSNIHIIDCQASGYGYGGVTQEYRFYHPPT